LSIDAIEAERYLNLINVSSFPHHQKKESQRKMLEGYKKIIKNIVSKERKFLSLQEIAAGLARKLNGR